MTPEQIKALYNAIVNRELGDSQIDRRVEIIARLEKETGLAFADTADFRAKMEAYLDRASNMGGIRLREERQRREWSIATLAKILDVSPRHLMRMEAGQADLSPNAFSFLHGDMNGKTKSRVSRLGSGDCAKNAVSGIPQREA